MVRLLVPALLGLLGAALGCRSALPDLQTIPFGGQPREFYLLEPRAKPEGLLFVLHGGSGTAAHMLKLVPDLRDLAAKHSILVVLPQGIGKAWNDGRLDPISQAHKDRLPDSEFLSTLGADLMHRYSIPEGRVFTMGISNGGMMSLRLVCDSPLFSGAVVIAAQMQIDYAETCRAAQKPRVLFIVGTKDPLVPYDGGPVSVLGRRRGVVYSADRSAQYWRAKNGCAGPVVQNNLPDTAQDSMHSRMETWNCSGGQVGVIHVEGGGHTWPGGSQYLPAAIVGPTTQDFSATRAALQWFGFEK